MSDLLTSALNFLSSAATPILRWALLMNLWTGALLVVALLLDRLLARRVSASWRILLFLVVFARLALPADWTSPVGLLSPASPAPQTASVVTAFTLDSVSAEVPAATGNALAAPVASYTPMNLLALAAIAAGIGLLAIRWGIHSRRLGGVIRSSSAARLEWAELAPRATTLEHPSAGPMVIGIARPRIILPGPIMQKLHPSSAARVIRHEAAHIARLDHLLAAGLHAVVMLCWPILPLWIAAARVRSLMELACDERALEGSDDTGRQSYAATLIDLATPGSRWSPLHSPLALGFGLSVAARVRAMKATRRWRNWAQAAIVLPAGLGLLACSGNGAAGGTKVAATPVSPPAVKAVPSASGDVSQTTTQIQLSLRVLSAWPKGAADGKVPVLADIPIIDTVFTNPAQAGEVRIISYEQADKIANGIKGGTIMAPRVTTAPDQKATIQIGEQDARGNQTTGMRFDLTPTVTADGCVVKIELEEYGEPNARKVTNVAINIPKGMTAAYLLPAKAGAEPRLILIDAGVRTTTTVVADASAWADKLEYPLVLFQTPMWTAEQVRTLLAKPLGNDWYLPLPQGEPQRLIASLGRPHFIASPALLLKDSETGSIQSSDRDKAGAAIGTKLEISGKDGPNGLTVNFRWFDADGQLLIEGREMLLSRELPEALVCVAPRKAGEHFRLLCINPKVIRSKAEYPFQTEGSFTEIGPGEPVLPPTPAR